MEDRRYCKYDMLDYYDRLLTQYLNALYSVGLDREDYKDISKIVRELDKIRSNAYYSWSGYGRLNKHLLSYDSRIVFGEDLKEKYISIEVH